MRHDRLQEDVMDFYKKPPTNNICEANKWQNERCAPFAARIQWQLCMCSCLKRWFVVRICLTPAFRRSASTFCILIPKPPFASAFKSQSTFVGM